MSTGIRTFTTCITNHTLEIQFYWAGRGTTGIPYRGFYGALISAISVVPNFQIPRAVEPPQTGSSKRTSRIYEAFLVGTPILAIFTALVVGIYWFKQWRKSLAHQGMDPTTDQEFARIRYSAILYVGSGVEHADSYTRGMFNDGFSFY